MMKKKTVKQLLFFLAALLFAGSLLYGTELPVTAEEEPAAEEPAAAEVLTEEEDHSFFSTEMLTAAQERYGQVVPGLPGENMPPVNETGKIIRGASLPFIGDAYIVAFHVDFPDMPFDEGDSEEMLQRAIGMDLNGNAAEPIFDDQYSSLRDYYHRASYGKLFISGDTFSYHAKKTKAEYTDTVELVREVMDAMDDTVDFGRYDANGDGRIDCVCFHIPYDPKDEWQGDWWPNCAELSHLGIEHDGVRVSSRVLLNRKLNVDSEEHPGEAGGVRVLIHEAGHAMGFPDYYPYNKAFDPAGGENELSGILTFDIMNDNVGDHNGFSKWIAGWLGESDVTRVVANADGVVATRGGTPVGTVGEDGSVTLDLASFDSEDISETGGIIVVGNDAGAPFSKYFLIQYDTYAGNQKVRYKVGGETQPISPGFRVFRVQADLTPSGDLKHNNTSDRLYNKLIELVDPDYKAAHTNGMYPLISNGFLQTTYSCMYYGGSSLTPTTAPSSNFKDNIDIGFTGISIDFLETGGTSGKLKISYSEKDKPSDEPLKVTLTEGKASPGSFTATLKGNRNLVLLAGPGAISAAVKEGEEFLGSDILYEYKMIGNDSIKATFYFDTDILRKGRTVLVRCRQGTFDIGEGAYSPYMEFEVPVLSDLAELSASGYVDTPPAENKGITLTTIQRDENGNLYFYGYNVPNYPQSSTEVYKYTFTEDNPENVKRELLPLGSAEREAAIQLVKATRETRMTERAAILPENPELGEYHVVGDAVKIGDYYYVASFLKMDYTTGMKNRMAVSKLDANGKLIEQVYPAGEDILQDPGSGSLVQILPGPNEKIAVLLFKPFQDRLLVLPRQLLSPMETIFLDRDLKTEARLINFSNGCGTWLKDGRFIAFGQRNQTTTEALDKGIKRADIISYDITTVIDPVSADVPVSPAGDQPKGTADGKPAAPDTGDANQPLLWVILMAVAICSMTVLVIAVRPAGKRKK